MNLPPWLRRMTPPAPRASAPAETGRAALDDDALDELDQDAHRALGLLRSPRYVGILQGGVLRSGRFLATPPVLLGVDDERGLVSAPTVDDMRRRRYLELDHDRARKAVEVRYYRDRRTMGHPVTEWFHDVRRTLIDPTGAVLSPSARLCAIDGDFICGG